MGESLDGRVQSALRDHATGAGRDGTARYAIPCAKIYGVAVKGIKALGKTLGRDQPRAEALWHMGGHEARLPASFVGDPAKLGAAQMDRWCREFDNWAGKDALGELKPGREGLGQPSHAETAHRGSLIGQERRGAALLRIGLPRGRMATPGLALRHLAPAAAAALKLPRRHPTGAYESSLLRAAAIRPVFTPIEGVFA
ncbi:MAG TPA: DNA alkylation repair protein [Ideonella sp.]|uniref:DNA alkylation repair protein n=1 Tax=Ideonella sp. TaxID=1929293 RepID=UPI002E2F5E1A|nr:DNA alkylation repair protein [Ideonella sp.]HEX5686111.1 DNA alkylation repair protein [Ideonella sp.]